MFWLLLALCLATTVFTACSDDDKDDDTPNSLVGTFWRGVIEDYDGRRSIEIDFVSENQVSRHIVGEPKKFDEVFLYTYTKPNIIFFTDIGKAEGFVSGRKLTIKEYGLIMEYDRIK
jgi:hypothetical protein